MRGKRVGGWWTGRPVSLAARSAQLAWPIPSQPLGYSRETFQPESYLFTTLRTMSDCIIIGTGLAALTAASRLTRAGFSPVLLEARDRIGGRASTKTVNQLKVDTGCSMIHGHQGGNPITDLAKKWQIVSLARSARPPLGRPPLTRPSHAQPVHIAPQAAPLVIGPDGESTRSAGRHGLRSYWW